MRIDEAECLITRERDALTGRVNGSRSGVRLKRERCGQVNNTIEIEVVPCELRQQIKSLREIAVLPGLDQSEMTFRQRNVLIARHCADYGNRQRRKRISNKRAVAIAADAIRESPRRHAQPDHAPRTRAQTPPLIGTGHARRAPE